MANTNPPSPTNKQEPKWYVQCRDCGQKIGFHPDVRGASGKCKPLNPDGSRHECPNSEYARKELAVKRGQVSDERLVLDTIAHVQDVNSRLKTCQLRIDRIDNTQEGKQ